ncbi:hypothetical protein BDY19DRAFT_928245 [Irpex rosettiformis]|uniref:Uncharacterized protein n=1 Tax=Irpex rosettiformis TaxID=378272 RepID=A0ACB8UCS5_9APHY|nr:hypothetical protein BDY19DRAFT_928245 [Irpex rosettiformis]
MSTHPDANDDFSDAPKPRQIRLNIPSRFYLLPGSAILLGLTLGFVRGSRTASLRFLAENVHHAPTTVQGWYFYNKTKNYRVIMGGLKEAGVEAVKLGTTAAGWVCFEEGMGRVGEKVPWAGEFKEVVAGTGTGAVFALAYRLPRKAATRAVVLGIMVGCAMRGLRWSQEHLRSHAQARAAELEAAAAEGRAEVVEDIKQVSKTISK